MSKIISTLLFTLFVFFGFSQTSSVNTIVIDGVIRSYRLYIPAIYDASNPVPVVFNFHGYGSNAIQQEFYGNFKPIADTANFILVHPDGLTDASGSTHWNCFGTTTVDDLGFISTLIDELATNYSIDTDRVYSTGMSNGGFMSYKLACQLSEKITAIASVTGSMIPSELAACNIEHMVPVMQIHGTADSIVTYEAGSFIGIDELVTYWVTANGCSTTPIVNALPDIDATDGCTASHFLYPDGLFGSTVEFYKITDGGHTWPGTAFTTGITNNDFNASVEIWRFFSAYNLNTLNVSISEQTLANSFHVYPNPSSNEVVTLTFDNSDKRSIQITNLQGQLIFETKKTTPMLTISLPEKGIYIIRLLENETVSTKKLLRN